MSIYIHSAFIEKTFPFLSSWLSPERSDCNALWRMHASHYSILQMRQCIILQNQKSSSQHLRSVLTNFQPQFCPQKLFVVFSSHCHTLWNIISSNYTVLVIRDNHHLFYTWLHSMTFRGTRRMSDIATQLTDFSTLAQNLKSMFHLWLPCVSETLVLLCEFHSNG